MRVSIDLQAHACVAESGLVDVVAHAWRGCRLCTCRSAASSLAVPVGELQVLLGARSRQMSPVS